MVSPRRTYSFPPDTLDWFERVVRRGKRASVIAGLLSEWLLNKQRDRMRRGVVAGCRAMADVYLETEREFHPLEEEVQRALESRSEGRRDRRRPARSGRRLRAKR